jgi:hypothetical protein
VADLDAEAGEARRRLLKEAWPQAEVKASFMSMSPLLRYSVDTGQGLP